MSHWRLIRYQFTQGGILFATVGPFIFPRLQDGKASNFFWMSPEIPRKLVWV